MAEDFKIKTLDDYMKQLSVTSPLKMPKTNPVSTTETLSKQKENLEKRLKAVGVDADNPSDSVVDNRNFIERALNLTPDQNVLFDIFEVIDRPIRSVFSAADAAVQGTDPLAGFWRGLSGQEEITATDILDSANVLDKDSLGGVETFAIDLAAEVFLDPLNLIPSGTLTKPFRSTSEFKVVETKKLIEKANNALTDGFFGKVAKAGGKKLKTQAGYFSDEIGGVIFDQDGFDAISKLTFEGMPTKAGEAAERLAAQTENSIISKAGKEMGLNLYVRKLQTTSAKSPDTVYLLKKTINQNGKKVNYFVEVHRLEIKGVNLEKASAAKTLEQFIQFTSPRVGVKKAKGAEELILDFTKQTKNKFKDMPELFEMIEEVLNSGRGVFKNAEDLTFAKMVEDFNKRYETAMNYINGVGVESFRKQLNALGVSADTLGSKSDTVFIQDMLRWLSSSKYNASKVRQSLEKAPKKFDNIKEIVELVSDYRKQFSDEIAKLGLPNKVNFEVDLVNEHKKLENLFKKAFKQSMDKYIMYVNNATGSKNMYLLDDVLADLNIKFRVEGSLDSTTRPFRLRVELGKNKTLDQLNIPDKTKEHLAEVLDNSQQLNRRLEDVTTPAVDQFETTKTLVERRQAAPVMLMLERFAKGDDIFAKPAKFAIDVLEKMKYTFNKGAGFSKLLSNQVSRIEGSGAQEIWREVTDLNRIADYLEGIDPKAGRYITRMLELGIDSSYDTLPQFINRSDDVLSRINYYFDRAEEGGFAVINKFENEAARKSAEDIFNQIMRNNNIDATFKIKTTKGGFQYLDVESDLDLSELKQLLDPSNLILSQSLRTFTYGNVRIDDDFRKFYELYKTDMQKIYDLNQRYTKKLFDEIGYAGFSVKDLDRAGYIRHTLTDEARQAQAANAPAVSSRFSRQGSNLLTPQRYQADIESVNGVLRDMMDLDYDVITADGFAAVRDQIEAVVLVEEQNDVFQAILRETRAMEKLDEADGFFKVIDNTKEAAQDLGPAYIIMSDSPDIEFAKMFDNLGPDLKNTWQEYMTELGYAPGKAVAMNRSVYETMKGLNNAYVNVADLVKQYDSFLNFWKSITLISPGFHVRNVFGNFANMYIGGMSTQDILRYQTQSAMDFQVYWKYRNNVVEAGGDVSVIPEELIQQYRDVENYYNNGVAQTRKGIRDLEKVKNLVLERLDPNTPGYRRVYQQLVRGNFQVAEYLDDVQRYAMYKWARSDAQLSSLYQGQLDDLVSQGATEEMIDKFKDAAARDKVMNALFDYSNLTSFEKNTMKRFFPFYTFMKNNFIFQAKSILDNPVKYARLGRAYDYWNENIGGISTEDLPDYAQDNLWLPLPFTVTEDDEDAIAFLKLNLPPSDFGELVSEPFKRGVSSLAAPIKLPIEFAYGRDSFTGQEFQSFPGEQNRLQDDEGVLPFLRDSRGTLAISSNPYIQKIANEIGLRVPQNYLTIALDIVDGIAGYQTGGETLTDISERLSLSGVQTQSNLELTKLYQDLEHLRNLRSLYEQKTGERLPSLDELGLGD